MGKSDLEKLQGKWQMIAFEMDGRSIPPGSAGIVIEGNNFTSLSMGAHYEGTMVVDATATPKTFDVKFHKGPHKGETSLGIYELDGDSWRICIGLAGVKRPTRFAAEPGTGHALETLARAVAGAAPERVQPAGEPVAELEGEWSMLSCFQDGKPMDAKICAGGRRVFRGNQTTMLVFDQVYMKSRFTVNRAATPSTIDYLDTNQLGIYEVDGERLRTCLAAAREARPVDFTATPGDRRTVSEWTRRILTPDF
ncbi:MAG: TIGR03067 domain-containing protein [Bryobacteraceae bacterium]